MEENGIERLRSRWPGEGIGKDEVRITGLEVFAHHGVFPEETRDGQRFVVNATLYTEISEAALRDDLDYAVDYGNVCHFIADWMRENTCRLLETVAERLARELLLKYDLISCLDLEIAKPQAPIGLPFGSVSVKIRRGRHRAYIGLGSNMGDREKYITFAIERLGEHPLNVVKRVSGLIETKPYGVLEQGDFLNGVLELETLMNPEELLEALHGIENAAGRKREIHWGPRTLDLDVLFYDNICYESETLLIPHPDLSNRDFVLRPMEEIAPFLRHPVTGKTVRELLEELTGRTGETASGEFRTESPRTDR